MRPLSLALALSTAACSAGDSATTLATPVRTTNLGGSTNGLYGEGPLFVMTEAERHEGRDLNGDGDAFDDVVSILDSEADTLLPTGLVVAQGFARGEVAPRPLISQDSTPTLLISEPGSGDADLDGDGTANDFVLFRYDPARRELVNLGLPAWSVFSNDEFVAFDASGELPRDLDGDGSIDLVPLRPTVHELATGTTYSLDRAGARILRLAGNSLALGIDESFAGDLNGDLDTFDFVLELHDLRRGLRQPIDLALTVSFGRFTQVFGDGDVWLADISEGGEGRDLNGDGDALDRVLHVFDAESGAVVRTLDGLTTFDGSVHAGIVFLLGPRSGARGAEMWLYSTGRDLLENTGLRGNHFVRREQDVALWVDEQDQDEDLDANGFLTSQVTVLYEPVSGRTYNLGVDGVPFALPGGLLLLSYEPNSARDWNGDGDQEDLVPFAWHEGEVRPTSLALAVSNARPIDASHALVLLDESEEDRNGDGDRFDTVAHVLDLRSGRLTNLGLATAVAFPLNGPVSLLLVSEAGEGRDLNGDGDAEDGVLHRLRLGP